MPSKMVTRAYIVEHDYGVDVFESALGAARFIQELLQRYNGSYYYIERGGLSKTSLINTIHEELGTDEGSRHYLKARKLPITRLAKYFRQGDVVNITAGVYYQARTKNEKDINNRLSFRIEPTDYFKGKNYPDYTRRLRGERK